MRVRPFVFALFLPLLLCACSRAPEETGEHSTANIQGTDAENLASYDANPPDAGFNRAASDAKAIATVDSIVAAHGGRAAYDRTRYFEWNFFGARDLVWDKLQKRARIEVPDKETVYLLDYSGTEPSGRVQVAGRELSDADSLAQLLQSARSILINDSYWLVHQFKLLDDGVTLKSLPDTEADPLSGRPSYVIDQTFEGVGDTPGNRYRLYVDKQNHRINTWEFYREAADEQPAMQTPWQGYRNYAGLLLSADRGGRFQLTNIKLPTEVAEERFTEF